MFEYFNYDIFVNSSEYVNIEMVSQVVQESTCVLPYSQFEFNVLECDLMK